MSFNQSLLFVLVCCFVQHLQAQHYQKGSITYLNGTTEPGEIAFMTRGITPQKILFRSAARSTAELGITQLAAFTLNRADGQQERYARKVAPLDKSPAVPLESDLSPTPKLIKDTVFLQVLVAAGAYNLYELQDNQGKTLFFLEEKTVEALVRKRHYMFNTQGSRSISVNNQYQRQLLALAKSCSNIRTNYGKLEYTREALMTVAEELNACKNAPVQYKLQTEKTPVRLGIMVGGNYTDLLLSRGATNTIEFTPNPQVSGGLFLEFFMPRSNQRLALVLEALYRRHAAEGKTRDDVDPFIERQYVLDMKFARLNVLGRVFAGPFFANLGFSSGYHFQNKSTRTVRYFSPGIPETTETDPWVQEADKIELGILGGIGVRLGQRFSLDFRFEYGNGLGKKITDFTTRTQTLSLFAGYRF